MTQQGKTKTFVRGSFLYLDETSGYQQRQNLLDTKEKVVVDKIGISSYQKQIREKMAEATSRKKESQSNKIVQKPVLIPIRDTPVQPVPQPVLDNQKCERAMQQQFDYFQTYISQKEKQRQFQEQQSRIVNDFLLKQKKLKQKEIENPPNPTVTIVMEKEEEKPQMQKTKKIIKMKIKKKNQNSNE